MLLDALFPNLNDGRLISAIAIACIGAAIGSLVLTVIALRRQRKQALNLSNALVLRDRLVQNLILSSLPEEGQDQVRVAVNQAFAKANEIWISEFVEAAYGKDEAAKVRRRLTDQVL